MSPLILGTPAARRVIQQVTEDLEILERRLVHEDDVRKLRERNEAIVTKYIQTFFARSPTVRSDERATASSDGEK